MEEVMGLASNWTTGSLVEDVMSELSFNDLLGEWSTPSAVLPGYAAYICGCKVTVTEEGLDIEGSAEEQEAVREYLRHISICELTERM